MARSRISRSYAAPALEEQPLLKRQRQTVQDIERDLKVLKQETGKAPLKKDLTALKDRWTLSAQIKGKDVTAIKASEQLWSELGRLHQVELQSLYGLEVAAAPAVPEATASVDGQVVNKPVIAGVAGCVCAASLAWHLLAKGAPAQAREDLPTATIAAPASAGASSSTAVDLEPPDDGHGCGDGGDDLNGNACPASSAPITTASASIPGSILVAADTDAHGGCSDNNNGDESDFELDTLPAAATDIHTSPTAGSSHAESCNSHWGATASGVASAAALVGLAVGTWWLISSIPGPPSLDLNTKAPSEEVSEELASSAVASLPAAMGYCTNTSKAHAVPALESTVSVAVTSPEAPAAVLSATASVVAATRATETVFENLPQASQTWDMSASVRGVSGSVKRRISQLQP